MQLVDTILSAFVSNAYADTAAAAAQPQQGGGFSLVIMLGIFVFFMYFMIWRPQSKRAKEHRNLVDSLAKGDEVVTAGGVLGKVAKISDNYILLALTDTVEIPVQKSSIVSALPKGTIKSI